MLALDTNILIRYFVQDDLVQAKKVEKILEKHSQFYINHIVLCEVVWVLEAVYEFPKIKTIELLEKILVTKQFEIQEKDVLWVAVSDFKKFNVDFADCLLGRKNKDEGYKTVTFDKSLEKLDYFEVLH